MSSETIFSCRLVLTVRTSQLFFYMNLRPVSLKTLLNLISFRAHIASVLERLRLDIDDGEMRELTVTLAEELWKEINSHCIRLKLLERARYLKNTFKP